MAENSDKVKQALELSKSIIKDIPDLLVAEIEKRKFHIEELKALTLLAESRLSRNQASLEEGKRLLDSPNSQSFSPNILSQIEAKMAELNDQIQKDEESIQKNKKNLSIFSARIKQFETYLQTFPARTFKEELNRSIVVSVGPDKQSPRP